MTIFLSSLVPFFVSLIVLYAVVRIASHNGIGLDRPNDRKIHRTPTPRIGGVGIFLAMAAAAPLLPLNQAVKGYLAGAAVIFVVGFIDDLKGIRWKAKMAGTVAATLLVVYLGGIRLDSLGNLFGMGEVTLGIWSVPFTVFCVLGVVNAINMIDGLNGLASGISVIALMLFAYFSAITGNTELLCLNLALAAATAAFLFFNFPRGRIFLGDCGSLVLGFTVAVMSVAIFQPGGSGFEPMLPILLLGLPIYDALRVMTGRVNMGRNPFHADKTHIHHIILRCFNLRHRHVTPLLWAVTLAFGVGAVVFREQEGWFILLVLLGGYILLSVMLSLMISGRLNRRVEVGWLAEKPRRIVEIEEDRQVM